MRSSFLFDLFLSQICFSSLLVQLSVLRSLDTRDALFTISQQKQKKKRGSERRISRRAILSKGDGALSFAISPLLVSNHIAGRVR